MKRLFIDLEICSKCPECVIRCSYFYHPGNNGITSLREYASFVLYCRQCEEAPCVDSCYHDALEKQPDGVLKRYNFRCTSCKSCVWACPFGTIYPEVIPYVNSKCDYCIGRANGSPPECVPTCPYKAVEFRDSLVEKPEENIFFIGDNLAVKSRKWERVV